MSTIFVTGGSRGLGRFIVLRFVKEGWNAAFTYASNKAAADETLKMAAEIDSDIKVGSYQLDMKEEKDIETVCDQVIADFPDVRAVVNNAATVRDNVAALMSNEDWNEVLSVNLTAPFLVSRAFLFHFLSQKKGSFIHMSSLSAEGSSGQINYATAKSGLQGLSMTLAKEYGKKGITSNIVTVGFVPTSMTNEHMNEYLSKYWLEHCPAKRVGTGEEIAAAVYFLCSDEAGFISGENIRISGAFTYAP